MPEILELKIVLHAPTASALRRARSNAINIRREAPQAVVRIIANAEAVASVLDHPDPENDPLTWLCPNTLHNLQREARPPLQVLDEGAVLALAYLQRVGWVYLRA